MAFRWPGLGAAATISCALGMYLLAAAMPVASASAEPRLQIFLPIVLHQQAASCQPIPEESYEAIPVDGLSPDPGVSAKDHPDLNLELRSYSENLSAYRGLVDYSGGYDPLAPRLQTLFGDARWPVMPHVYRVYQWDGQWPGTYGVYPILSPDVTLVGLESTAGEKIHVPTRAAEIFHDTITGKHYVAMVLYAAPDRITLKYTRDDHVITGYTIHIEGICVEPRLLALYDALAATGRTYLPGLRFGQAIGRAIDGEIGVAVRDNGSFMDPRSRKDWWQGLESAAVPVPQLDASGELWFIEQQRRLASGACP